MNEKLQYASMLEIPVSTCNISAVKPKKKRLSRRKKVNDEQIKEQLLQKINEQDALDKRPLLQEGEQAESLMNQSNFEQEQETATVYQNKPKKRGFSIIGVQLAIIGVLIASIFLTNAVYENSGINVFLRGVFGVETQTVDTREFDDFAPIISMGDNYDLSLEEGVISFAGKGSVYSACDGIVENVIKGEDDKYTLEITHSENFKSVISGIERIYVSEGDVVKAKIPVGYLEPDGATMCFFGSDGEIIENYQIENDMVVWAV